MRRRADSRRRCLTALLIALPLLAPRPARAQEEESADVMRALDLESAGKNREAADLFRRALRVSPTPGALLGLERVYAELGASDSLLPVLDTLIAQSPRNSLFRSVQLRTLQILRRDDQLRAAFERWVRDVPRDPTPFREYARALIQLGRPALADSVVQLSRRALGSARELAFETAQLRAAQGLWEPSAQAWRQALADAPYLAGTASYQLAPAPAAARGAIRAIFAALPVELGVRRALAELELAWGRPRDAWEAIRVLPPDTAAAAAWTEFGERALADGRYGMARDALAAALAVHRAPDVAIQAATAALRGGAPADVFTLLPVSEIDADPAQRARDYLPLLVEALSTLGRTGEAEALVAKYDRWLAPGQRARLSRGLASGWVRAGDLPRARAALGAAGAEGDSSEAAGWIALYEGRLGAARTFLRSAREPGPELALALGILSRVHAEESPSLGASFLALARGDSVGAATSFVAAADRHPEAASALLLAASRLRLAHGDRAAAVALWSRIVSQLGDTPEAAEAELDWARALRRDGDSAAAIVHLEHLILSAPQSALLPQARRELDLARSAVPSK
jgi:tetratricopeptide (TPR) repeat protein